MADAQLAFGSQFDDVASVYFHHPAQLGDDYLQARIQIDRCRQLGCQAGYDGLTRLVQFDLAFE
jgi:hypothetical protein